MDPLVDQAFPNARCFKRIVICKRDPDLFSNAVGRRMQELFEAEEHILELFANMGVEGWTVKQLVQYIVDTLVGQIRLPDKGVEGFERLLDYVWFHMVGTHVPEETLERLTEQNRMLQWFALYPNDNYICVALDHHETPLYWLSIKESINYKVFYVDGFAKSNLGALAAFYMGEERFNLRCGAPFFSFVIDKMMNQLIPNPRGSYFFITALKGTRTILKHIEQAGAEEEEEEEGENEYEEEENEDEVYPFGLTKFKHVAFRDTELQMKEHARFMWNPAHVYMVYEEFTRAWGRLENVNSCIGCGIRAAKWRHPDNPKRAFCSINCSKTE